MTMTLDGLSASVSLSHLRGKLLSSSRALLVRQQGERHTKVLLPTRRQPPGPANRIAEERWVVLFFF